MFSGREDNGRLFWLEERMWRWSTVGLAPHMVARRDGEGSCLAVG